MKRIYFENQILCFECTGAGCKQCRGKGIESFQSFFLNSKLDYFSARIEYLNSLKFL